MDNIPDFEDIRPFNDSEVKEVMQRMVDHPSFHKLMKYVYPDQPLQPILDKLQHIDSIGQFQQQIAYPAMRRVIDHTTDALTFSGIDNISKEQSYLFISNHRDIILDSAILNVILLENGFDTIETAIGNNLLSDEFVTDLTRLNKNFVVKRNTTQREFYENSMKLSAYIDYTLTEKQASVWIAQKEGRTKDGMDKTQPGLLKMLSISCEEEIRFCFKKRNITPVSISYEFDPCDVLKIRELKALQRDEKYQKQPGEDFRSIIQGITGRKGRVHISIGTPIVQELKELADEPNLNEKLKTLGASIDQQIFKNYKLWPTNFIAADMISGKDTYRTEYTTAEKSYFETYAYERLKKQGLSERKDLEILLMMYANPVKNCLMLQDS